MEYVISHWTKMSFVIQGMISIPNPNKPVKSVDVLKRLFKQTLLHQNFHVCTNVAELASIFKRLLRLVPHPYIYIYIYLHHSVATWQLHSYYRSLLIITIRVPVYLSPYRAINLLAAIKCVYARVRVVKFALVKSRPR